MELYSVNKSLVKVLEDLGLGYKIIDDNSINTIDTITIDIQQQQNTNISKDIKEHNFYVDLYILKDKKSKKKLYEDSFIIKDSIKNISINNYIVNVDIISETVRNIVVDEYKVYACIINFNLKIKGE